MKIKHLCLHLNCICLKTKMLLLIFNQIHTSLILVASRKLCNIITYINAYRLNHVTKKQEVESLIQLQKCTCANFFCMYNVFKNTMSLCQSHT